MPKPDYPEAGEVISSAWGSAFIDYAGEKWTYIPTGRHTVVDDVAGQTAIQSAEVINLPLDDDRVIAAEIAMIIRKEDGSNSHLAVYDYDTGAEAGRAYTSGVANRGGYAGNMKVGVGGVNRRQIKWNTSAGGAGVHVWIYCYGYWLCETPLP